MAGRPRLPDAVHKASGAALKNPQRFKDRKPPKVQPLGDPPEWMGEAERQSWADFAAELPWLGQSDRTVLTSACRLRARLEDGTLPDSLFAELRQTLNAMGATPSARSKVTAPEPEDDDPAAEFFN